jgi:hypothetical protein
MDNAGRVVVKTKTKEEEWATGGVIEVGYVIERD